MIRKKLLLYSFFILTIMITIHLPNALSAPSFEYLVKNEIQKKFPNSKIELTTPIKLKEGFDVNQVTGVNYIGDNSRGEAFLRIQSKNQNIEITVPYESWVSAYVSTKKILPGEHISPENFTIQEINTSTGQNRIYRGLILGINEDLKKLEARQTILLGQLLTSYAVKKIPDAKQGDVVGLKLISNGVVLMSKGILRESGLFGSTLRVLSQKNKKEMIGKLTEEGVVEVHL